MKVLIIEDEAPAFRRLQKILEELEPTIEIVEVLDSVEESVKWLKNHNIPDLIFMDIQLSDGISFEIFDQVPIRKPVIFTTAFDEYTLRAFKVNSVDYLLKPIKKEELKESLEKFKALKQEYGNAVVDISEVVKSIRLDEKHYKTRFLVKQGEKMSSVEADHIAFFHTQHGVVYLVTRSGKKYLMDLTLDDLQNQLDPGVFYRANRQFIVSYQSVSTVHRYHKGKLLIEAVPKPEEGIVVSAEKASDFKAWLGS